MFEVEALENGARLAEAVPDLLVKAERALGDDPFLSRLLACADTFMDDQSPRKPGRRTTCGDELTAHQTYSQSKGEAPFADLDDEALLSALQATHRAISADHAHRALLITELAQRRATNAVTELTGRKARGKQALTLGARALGEEVALELSLSKATAATLVDSCVGLCTEAPETFDALAGGTIDWEKATAILGLVQTLVHAQENTNPELDPADQADPETLGRALEDELLKKAAKHPVNTVRKAGARAMIEISPHSAEHRHTIKRSHRAFWFTPDDDSMARIGGYLPADAGLRTKHALTRLAYHARNAAGPDDHRTLDQLRIDSLVNTITAAADKLHPEATPSGSAETAPEGHETATFSKNPASPPSPARTTTSTSSKSTTSFEESSAPPATGTTAPPPTASEAETATTAAPADTANRETRLAEPTPDPGQTRNDYGRHAAHEDSGRCAGAGPGRGRSGSDPRVTITISASTLVGLDHQAGFLQEYGPVVASMARDVAATGIWRCAITDDVHGTLLGLGTSTFTSAYKPTRKLRQYLMTRDRICRVPGCNTPVELCDVDHCTPWPHGPTCECNTEFLCGTHHRLKHEMGFTLTPSTNADDPPGTLYWGTPAGHQFPSYPTQIGPVPPAVNRSGGPDAPHERHNLGGPEDPGGREIPRGSEEPATSDNPIRPKDPDGPGATDGPGGPIPAHPPTCSACTDADNDISAETEAARAFDEELARARAAAATRRIRLTHRPRGPADPDYDDPFFWNSDGDQGRPDSPGSRVLNPHCHRETLGPITSDSAGATPADVPSADSAASTKNTPTKRWVSRIRCSLSTLEAKPLDLDGPPPF